MKWISLKERMPELKKPVLLIDAEKYKKGIINYQDCHKIMGTGFWYERLLCRYEDEESLKDIIRCSSYVKEPTHWAELPKGPHDEMD